MKIFTIIDYWFPGVGGGPIHVAEVASRLSQFSEVEVTVITSNLTTGSSTQMPAKYNDLKVIRLGKSLPYSSWKGRLNFLVHLFLFLLKHDFDILHVHPFISIPVGKLISLIKGKPMVVTVHVLSQDISGVSQKTWLAKSLQSVDRFFTFHVHYSAQIFVDKNLIRERNVNKNLFFIPNGVDISSFDQVKIKKAKGFQILFVGRFHPQKNLFALIEAVSQVVVIHPHISLLLVGEGEEEDSLRRKVNEQKLTSSVRILKPLYGRDLIAMYKSSYLFILPSTYEGFPISLLEAWAASIPVAATKVGMVRELVKEGVNGLIIPKPDSRDVARTLIRAINHQNLAALGREGYKVALQYSWDSVARQTYRLYRQYA